MRLVGSAETTLRHSQKMNDENQFISVVQSQLDKPFPAFFIWTEFFYYCSRRDLNLNRARPPNQKLLSDRDIVSSEQMKKMTRAKIVVTNFHALMLRIRCGHQDHQADCGTNIRADPN